MRRKTHYLSRDLNLKVNRVYFFLNSMCKTHFFSLLLCVKVLQHPHAITIFEDFVYWTDRYINRVMRAHKWHGVNQTVMLFNLPQPMGLVTVHPARQPAGMVKIIYTNLCCSRSIVCVNTLRLVC